MPEVVSNTSCLIILRRIDRLSLLRSLYATISITTAVRAEYAEPLPDWVATADPASESTVRALSAQVHPGEAATIAVAVERPGSVIILDDRKARALAAALQLRVTGTLGVLLRAHRRGLLPPFPEVIAELRAHRFHISPQLETTLIQLAQQA